MELSSELQADLDHKISRWPHYQYYGGIEGSLKPNFSMRTLGVIFGLNGYEEIDSKICDEAVRIAKESKNTRDDVFARKDSVDWASGVTPIHTTDASLEDNDKYAVVSPEEIIGRIKQHDVVSWHQDPATRHLFATVPENYAGRHVFMTAPRENLSMLQRAGFHRLWLFFLAPDKDAWMDSQSGKSDQPGFDAFLEETMSSVEWANGLRKDSPRNMNKMIYSPDSDSLNRVAKAIVSKVVSLGIIDREHGDNEKSRHEYVDEESVFEFHTNQIHMSAMMPDVYLSE